MTSIDSRQLIAALALCVTGTAFAQQDDARTSGLEEITVTAQRRAESLQTVPLAVTAFSADELQKQGIDNIKSLTERVPGLTMGQFNPGQPQVYIRGVGSNVRGAAEDPGVIMYIDEVPIGRAQGMDIDLYDLERVEVLRGPQGTIYGRNAAGGAINLITTKPTEETRWALEGTFGDYKTAGGRGFVSGALGDDVFGKLAVSYKRQDSYLINNVGLYARSFPTTSAFDNRGLEGTSSQSVRGQLRFTPGDALELNLTGYYSASDADSATRHFFIGANAAGARTGTIAIADHILVPGYADDYRNIFVDDAGSYRAQASGVNFRVDYDLTPSMVLTSLSAYRYATALAIEPGLGSPALSTVRLNNTTAAQGVGFVFDGNNDYRDTDRMLMEDLRVSSNGDGRLQWVAGLFYLDEEVYRNETNSTGVKVRGAGGAIVGAPNNVLGGEEQFSTTKSYAVYGQGTYSFNDMWSATLGVRYTEDEKDFRGIGTAGGAGTIASNYEVRARKKWSATTPKATLDFKPTDRAMVYLTWSEGYKAGGYPNLAVNGVVASTPYDPESAVNYEIGAKTEWFDRRLRVNLSLFTIDYEDLQVLVQLVPVGSPPTVAGSLFTINAATAESKGCELEFSLAPTDRLFFSGSVSKLNAEFTSFNAPPGFVVTGGAPITAGLNLRNSPDIAWNVLARYTQPLANGGSLGFQGEALHKDRVYQDPANLEYAAIPGYDLANFRIGYTTPSGKVEFAAVLTNAFDENYLVHNFPAAGQGLGRAGPPSMLSFTVAVRN
jgi:iron complex outermembrane receptor protein